MMIADNFDLSGSMEFLLEAEKRVANGDIGASFGSAMGNGFDLLSGCDETQDYSWARISYRDGTMKRVDLLDESGKDVGAWSLYPEERHMLIKVTGGTREQAVCEVLRQWRDPGPGFPSIRGKNGLIPLAPSAADKAELQKSWDMARARANEAE